MAHYTRAEVIKILHDFLEGTGGDYDWGDFITSRISDPELEAIRDRCNGLSDEFPPDKPKTYCNERGLAVIRGFLEYLQSAPA
jgi:hypothetical protein